MNNFTKFLQKFFPMHPSRGNKDIQNIYKKVCENNTLTEIFINKFNQKNINKSEVFLILYKNKFTKILLYIGLNDIDSINYCIRASIEYLLKFIFYIQNDLEIEHVNKTTFRYLNESLKDKDKELYEDMYKDVQSLISYYGNYSNKLHGKNNIKIDNETIYLQEILTKENIDYRKLSNDIYKMVDKYEIIMVKILKLNIKQLAANEIFRIGNFWDKDKIKKILNS